MVPTSHPPQRVTYDADKTEPPETPQQQAAIVMQLQELAEPNVATCSIDNPTCDGPQEGPEDIPASSHTDPSSSRSSGAKRSIPGENSKPPQGPIKPYKGPMSQIKQKITALENDKIKIGVDLDRAGKEPSRSRLAMVGLDVADPCCIGHTLSLTSRPFAVARQSFMCFHRCGVLGKFSSYPRKVEERQPDQQLGQRSACAAKLLWLQGCQLLVRPTLAV